MKSPDVPARTSCPAFFNWTPPLVWLGQHCRLDFIPSPPTVVEALRPATPCFVCLSSQLCSRPSFHQPHCIGSYHISSAVMEHPGECCPPSSPQLRPWSISWLTLVPLRCSSRNSVRHHDVDDRQRPGAAGHPHQLLRATRLLHSPALPRPVLLQGNSPSSARSRVPVAAAVHLQMVPDAQSQHRYPHRLCGYVVTFYVIR